MDASSHNHQLRSKRNRNASTNDDSVKLPATKKRRSALRRDTFEPLIESSVNELAGQSETPSQPASLAHPTTNGTSVKPRREVAPQDMLQTRDLTLRGSKKTEKRVEKGAGLSTLTDTEFYTINHLPSLPERIRLQPQIKYSCVISPEHDYVLALTHTDALLWSYGASSSTPSSRDLITFKLPFPTAFAEDPLPLGAFTPRSANGEPGVIVVSPKSGRVVYWETLTLASAYTAAQTSNAVEGSIPGVTNTDTVKELVPAEPIGFVLSLASGRVAHLTIRDQLGRPSIGIQFMRRQPVASLRGGIFGSIRHVFGADRRKGTAIVRPGRSARAQRDIIICTEDADMEFWTNNLLTGNTLTRSFSIKEQLAASVAKPGENPYEVFKIIDLATTASVTSHELTHNSQPDFSNLIFLVAASRGGSWSYFLLETIVDGDGTAQTRVIHPIKDYTTNVFDESAFHARLCLSQTSAVAFVVFDKAVAIASLAKITESPSSQLAADKSALPLPFQDCVRLRDNGSYHVINFAAEENDTSSNCVIAIQGYGLIRIESHLKSYLDIEEEPVISQLSAKTKLEQAIFFGHKADSPLDLLRSFKKNYPRIDISVAFLNVSKEITTSRGKHIPKSSSSVAEHLASRARLLQQLAEYALQTYPKYLDRADRFKLLWDAERIASAQALWRTQEKIQSAYPKNDREEDQELTYFNFALTTMSNKSRKVPDEEKGETDAVRHWLIHDVHHISELLAEFTDAIRELDEAAMRDPHLQADFFDEGTELWTSAFQAAFRFREDNAAVWGLGNETFENGVLHSAYPQALPMVWTSIDDQAEFGQTFVDFVCKFLTEWWNFSSLRQNGSTNPKSKKDKQLPERPNGELYEAPPRKVLEKLADRLPTLVELLERVIKETIIHKQGKIDSKDIPEDQKEAAIEALGHQYKIITATCMLAIAPFNRNGALQLAEEHGDTDLLVDLNLSHLQELISLRNLHPDDDEEIVRKIEELQDHVETYYARFGNNWAYSRFRNMVQDGELSDLIAEGQSDNGKKQSFLSWFFDYCLKDGQRVGKLSWINDVIGKQNYNSACQMLEDVAHKEEDDIWSLKTELSLAKLAGLAALEHETPTVNESKIENIGVELQYLQIIESLAWVVNSVLDDALDDQGAHEIAVDRFVPKTIKKPQTRKNLEKTLSRLAINQVVSLGQLVDALTLLDLSKAEVDEDEMDVDLDNIVGEEYAYALRAIALAPTREATPKEKENLKKMVWRRLLTKDNWIDINKTAGKSDKQVKETMQQTALYHALLDCIKRAREGGIGLDLLGFNDIVESGASDGDLSDEAKADSATLKKYIEKARLQEHYESLLVEAREDARRLLDDAGEAMAEDIFGSAVNGNHT